MSTERVFAIHEQADWASDHNTPTRWLLGHELIDCGTDDISFCHVNNLWQWDYSDLTIGDVDDVFYYGRETLTDCKTALDECISRDRGRPEDSWRRMNAAWTHADAKVVVCF